MPTKWSSDADFDHFVDFNKMINLVMRVRK